IGKKFSPSCKRFHMALTPPSPSFSATHPDTATSRASTRASTMKSANRQTRLLSRSALSVALAGSMLLAVPDAHAQATGATVRGQVSADQAPAAGATVTVTNVDTGLTRSVRTSASGSYALAGLPPGTYRIDVVADGQARSETETLAVGLEAAAAVADDTTDMDTRVVTGTRLVETRTSEIATYVTPKQIEALPQGTRNFLAFADTVPGVQFIRDASGNTRLRSG